MSAGAPQSAIDALRMDKDVIVIDKSSWFEGLHSSISYAASRKNFEDYLYDPLMRIFGTYAETCSHKNYKVAVIPQGCFELRADSSARVTRKLSDVLFTLHSESTGDPDDPQYGKSRLGGWVEGKPWSQSPKNPKKKGEANADKKQDAPGGNDDEHDKNGKGKGIAEDVRVNEGDIPHDEGNVEDDHRPDVEEVEAGEDSAMPIDPPSIEDASALALDDKEVVRRLVEDLHQLCQQAYFAFHHCVEDKLYAFITYGITISCFEFTRPADWDSIRGDNKGKVKAPIPVLSNEFMVFKDTINPRLNRAFRLLTASLDMSYQPSWFDPPDHNIGEPNLTLAREAIRKYQLKHGENDGADGSLDEGLNGSPHGSTSSEESKQSPDWKPTGKEAAAPVAELWPKLRSGKGGFGLLELDLEPTARNDGTETSEPTPEQQDAADQATSDTDDSPLAQRLQQNLAQPGYAPLATAEAPATSSVPEIASPSTRGTAGNTRMPAFNALVPRTNSGDKFITPKNRSKRIPQPRGKARRQETTDLPAEANGPTLSGPSRTLISDAETASDGFVRSESHETTGRKARTGVPSGIRPRKRNRPCSPSPDGDDTSLPNDEGDAPVAGPSKKQRVPPEADERAADDAGDPSSVARMVAEATVSATEPSNSPAADLMPSPSPLTAPESARGSTAAVGTYCPPALSTRSRTRLAAAMIAQPAVSGPSQLAHGPLPGGRNNRKRKDSKKSRG